MNLDGKQERWLTASWSSSSKKKKEIWFCRLGWLEFCWVDNERILLSTYYLCPHRRPIPLNSIKKEAMCKVCLSYGLISMQKPQHFAKFFSSQEDFMLHILNLICPNILKVLSFFTFLGIDFDEFAPLCPVSLFFLLGWHWFQLVYAQQIKGSF